MKKTTFLAFIAILSFKSVNAQVLLNENFNNYTLGNLGTDPTGIIPGQGGWLTTCYDTPSNNAFTITNEPFRGKGLTLNTPKNEHIGVLKKDLNILIDQRTKGNNVIKFEIDYYTGSQYYMLGSNGSQGYSNIRLVYDKTSKYFFEYYHSLSYQSPSIHARYHDGTSYSNLVRLGNGTWYDHLPAETWVTFIVYLDYTNKKIYFETPYFGKVVVGDFFNKSTSTNLIEDFKPIEISLLTYANTVSNVQYMDHKYDNIKITALKAVPANITALSINEQLAQKFNLYPNPATSIVNIANSKNISVKQVEIYDLAGKLINTQHFNDETEIQLNIEALTSGTYLLHLQTNEGMAIKKLIKK